MIMKNCRATAVSLALTVFGAPVLNGAGTTASAQTAGQPAAPVARSQVHALARLEPESGLIVIGARPGARIEKVAVSEDQDVQAGAILAVLEGHDLRARQLALAEAQRDAARFQRKLRREQLALERDRFDRLKQPRLDSLRSTISDLKSKVAPAAEARKADAAGKTKDSAEPPAVPALGGATALGGGMVPAVVRDMLAAQLRAELEKTQLQLKELEVSLDLLDRQRKLEDEPVAENAPDLTVLDRQVELARVELAQSEVRAPIAGRVLAVLARAGEVSAGPLLTMGDVRSMVARAEVFQTDVLDIGTGDAADVNILGRTVAGEVTRVGTTVGRNAITSLDPTALADRRVVEVVVRLADPSLASRLVNMQVDVAFRTRPPGGAARSP
jgi:HlyD family secretion protein